MKYHIITYGCQMNQSDSERIATILRKSGFKLSPTAEKADLLIINICSIRKAAIDRASSRIKRAQQKLLLTGCILSKDKRRFRKYCNGIFDINDLLKLPSLLEKLGFNIKKETQKTRHYLKILPELKSSISASIPIMTGCNNACSYCVVPFTRGQEISRPMEDILCEAKILARHGIKEIWLLGQNVNSYKPSFAHLLKQVNDIEGDFWIRFTSSHPKDLTDEVIEIFAKSERITPYFNLPIQSGDDKVLKAMNRPYTVKKYKDLIKKVRSAFRECRKGLEKELTVSSDVIIGFPGETKRHFENTKKTFREIGFAFAYISRYSPRPQTVSIKLKDDVSPQEKKEREKELIKIIEKSALEFNKKFLDKTVDVLILKKKKDFYVGKTRHYQTIRLASDIRCKLGEFIKVKVTKITPYGLEGRIQ